MTALYARLIGAVVLIVALLAGWHFLTAHYIHQGEQHVRTEWQAATAAANEDARKLEQARQRRADESAQLAAQREARIRADAVGARRESLGLRDDLNAANDYARQSRSAAERTAGVATDLLGRCEAEYLGVAEAAARADSESRQLRDAWPR